MYYLPRFEISMLVSLSLTEPLLVLVPSNCLFFQQDNRTGCISSHEFQPSSRGCVQGPYLWAIRHQFLNPAVFSIMLLPNTLFLFQRLPLCEALYLLSLRRQILNLASRCICARIAFRLLESQACPL